jgi:GrpB-like predicted nucleotidyltransferase (UPF0157 family)
VRIHPLWRPYDPPTEDQISAARLVPLTGQRVEVVPPDPGWPEQYLVVHARLVAALGDQVIDVEHVGSTSLPGLWAKPMIDVDLTVPDSSDEPAWLPALEAAGFELRVREPEWEEHRVVRGQGPVSNVHVWSPGAREPQRHVAFRDWLASHARAREAYGALTADLAMQGFTDPMLYNNAKAGFIYDLYEQIFAADPAYPHDPRPRT